MSVTRSIVAAGLAVLVAAQVAACGSDDEQASVPRRTATQPQRTVTVTLPPASTTTRPAPRKREFAFDALPLPASIRQKVTGSSWREGCPTTLDELRYVEMSHWGFDGKVRTGELIINRTAVDAARTAFGTLFDKRFPIRRMHLVDNYGADDHASIEADNTSSFNCRPATGSTRWSEHAYGRAIDINPIENPYVYADGSSTHAGSRPYLDRSQRRPGMAREGGTLVEAFDAVGWGWGGRWSPAVDLQHFSANGR